MSLSDFLPAQYGIPIALIFMAIGFYLLWKGTNFNK